MAIAANHTQATTRRPAQLALRRERAFRSARRHTARVRAFKVLFPLISFALSGLYIVPAVVAFSTSKGGGVEFDGVTVTVGSLKMEHPHYSGDHPTYGAYKIDADSATQTVKATDVVTLDKITAEVISPSKETTTLTAPDGVLRTKQETLTLDNGAVISGTNGLWAKLLKAEVSFKDRVVTTRDPVQLRYHDSTINADSAVIYTSESRVEFSGNVRVHLEREPAAKTPSVQAHLAQPGPQMNWASQMSMEPAAGQTGTPEQASPPEHDQAPGRRPGERR